MTKKFLMLALMAGLASSLAFAADTAKSTASAGNSQPAAISSTANTPQDQNQPCVPEDKRNNHNTQSAPSNQEQEFERVLQGIYG